MGLTALQATLSRTLADIESGLVSNGQAVSAGFHTVLRTFHEWMARHRPASADPLDHVQRCMEDLGHRTRVGARDFQERVVPAVESVIGHVSTFLQEVVVPTVERMRDPLTELFAEALGARFPNPDTPRTASPVSSEPEVAPAEPASSAETVVSSASASASTHGSHLWTEGDTASELDVCETSSEVSADSECSAAWSMCEDVE